MDILSTPYLHGMTAGLHGRPILAPHSAAFRRGWLDGRVAGAEQYLKLKALERQFQADWARGQVKWSQPGDPAKW